jgi:hypothetical protein
MSRFGELFFLAKIQRITWNAMNREPRRRNQNRAQPSKRHEVGKINYRNPSLFSLIH